MKERFNRDVAQAVLDELLRAGFDRREILVTHRRANGDGEGNGGAWLASEVSPEGLLYASCGQQLSGKVLTAESMRARILEFGPHLKVRITLLPLIKEDAPLTPRRAGQLTVTNNVINVDENGNGDVDEVDANEQGDEV